MHKVLINLKIFTIITFLTISSSSKSIAVPAAPIKHILSQPEGLSFVAIQWGDENLHGWETEDGYTIIFDNEIKSWAYAIHDNMGNLISSKKIVRKDHLPHNLVKHLRPIAKDRYIIYKKKFTRERQINIVQEAGSTSGIANIPVILINFADTTPIYQTSDFHNLLFGTGNLSMKDYYEEVSYGIFSISAGSAGIVGWYSSKNTHDYYGVNVEGFDAWPGDLVYEAVQAADSIVNFADYDTDKDGYVDVVAIIHQGTGEEASGSETDIWSHSWELNTACQYFTSGFGSHYCEYITDDPGNSGYPVKVNDYIILPEKLYNEICTIGVFAHEYGHSLGLPDLYDTDSTSSGVGDWSLMASGSWNKVSRSGDSPAHLDAWCKYFLGWVTPAQVSDTFINIQIKQAATDADVYQLLSGSPSTGGEYFLVENRQKAGFDRGLPGAGLLIWHIDESMINNDREWYPGCLSHECMPTFHYHVSLEQADNLWQLEKGINKGDSGDPYPGSTNNRSFNSSSVPSSNLWNGTLSSVSITNIGDSGSVMTANFSVSVKTIECSSWSEVIAKYKDYVYEKITWQEIIKCYDEYTK